MSKGPFDSLNIYSLWVTIFGFQNTSEDGPFINPENFYMVDGDGWVESFFLFFVRDTHLTCSLDIALYV